MNYITTVPEITHLHVRNLDGLTTTIPLKSMLVTDDPKVLVHLRDDNEGLVLECSSKLFKNSDSLLNSITLLSDGEQGPDSKSILVTCNDSTTLIPISRITKLLRTPPEFKVGILADSLEGLISCSIAFSVAFASNIEQIDSVWML